MIAHCETIHTWKVAVLYSIETNVDLSSIPLALSVGLL